MWPLFGPEQTEQTPLFPELIAGLNEIKRHRIGGLMLVRDSNADKQRRPRPWPNGTRGDLTYMLYEFKRIAKADHLPDAMTFESLRHGGPRRNR